MDGTRKKAEPKSQSEPSSTNSQGMGRLVYSIDLEDLYIMAALQGFCASACSMPTHRIVEAANDVGTKAFLQRQENKQCAKSPTYSELLAFWHLHLESCPPKPDQSKVCLTPLEESVSKLSTAVEKLGTLVSTDPPVG